LRHIYDEARRELIAGKYQFTGRKQITAALTALPTAQGKLQLRGKLLDLFKDEEAKLVRQAEERQ